MTFSAVAVLGLVLCATLYLVTRDVLLDDFEHDLATDFIHVAGLTKVFPDGDVFADVDSEVVTDYAHGGPKLFQVLSADGADVLDRSVWLERDGSFLDAPRLDDTPGARAVYDTVLPDGRPAMARLQVVDAQWGWYDADPTLDVGEEIRSTVVQVLVARDRTRLDDSLHLLLVSMATVAVLLPLACWGIVHVAVGIGLRPLDTLAAHVAAIRSTDGDQHLSAEWPEEIRPVAVKLNGLLERLEEAGRRQRRFAADAAHELRTPLAELRTATDVALRSRGDGARLARAVEQANHVSRHMATTVESLLRLARQEDARLELSRRPVELQAMLVELVARDRERLDARGLRVDLSGLRPTTLDSDVCLLHTIFSNLVGNAVSHAPDGTVIRVGSPDGAAGIRIDNDAPELREEDVAQLFAPFWRHPDKRRDGEHSGLGLALVRDAAERLGLGVTATLDAERLAITVDWPVHALSPLSPLGAIRREGRPRERHAEDAEQHGAVLHRHLEVRIVDAPT